MKAVHLDCVPPSWPGYPHAVTAGGFCFISGLMPLREDGEFVSAWSELAGEGAAMGSGFAAVDAQTGPYGAQSWRVFHLIESLMASQGGTLDDLLRIHTYQKEKRFFPVRERVRMKFEPHAPAPSSGIGVRAASPDGKAWVVNDGIAIAPREWTFENRRRVLRPRGSLPSVSHYVQGVEAGPYIFTAGQLPIDSSKPGKPLVRGYDDVPEEGRFLQVGRSHTDTRNGPIAAQAWFCYDHIRRILQGAGSRMEEIVNVTVYLQDMRDFFTFHEVHRHFFPNSPPALTVTGFDEVGHKGTLIEIEATAMRPAEGLARTAILEAGALRPDAHAALAVVAGPLIYISGQTGVDGEGRAIEDAASLPRPLRPGAAAVARASGRPAAAFQAAAVLEKLAAILGEAGISLSALTKVILYLEDFGDFPAFDLALRDRLPGAKPSFSCVEIPKASPVPGARMCVEAIAVKE